MDKDVVPLLRCPDSGADLDLEIEDEADNRIHSGTLISKQTGRRFSISNGIAEMLPSSDHGSPKPITISNTIGWENRVMEMEKGFLTKLFTPFECTAFRHAVELSAEDCVLEVGSGRGRLSTHFASIPRRYICVDTSIKNLRICQERILNKGFRYATWIQADPGRLPFHNDCIDKLLCPQIIAHIPTAAGRETAVAEMARVCKPTALMAISGYSYDLFASIRRDKTGKHKGGLEYYRFTKQEFTNLLRTAMLLDEVSQSLQYVWVGAGVPKKTSH